MESVPFLGVARQIRDEHLARSLGFPPDLELWEAASCDLPIVRHRRGRDGQMQHDPVGVFRVRAVMTPLSTLHSLMGREDVPTLDITDEHGEASQWGVLSMEVTPDQSSVSVHFMTRADGTRKYLVSGDLTQFPTKAAWDHAMASAWQALELIQESERRRPGRPTNTKRYPDVESLLVELRWFASRHGRMPDSKAEFVKSVGVSRDTLDKALDAFGASWEHVRGAA